MNMIRDDLYWTPAQHVEILHRGSVKNPGGKIVFFGYKNEHIQPTPGDYASMLTAIFGGKQQYGEVGIERNPHKNWQHFLFPTLDEIGTDRFAEQINKLTGEKDVYFSQQSFLRRPGQRQERHVSQMGSLYADIDKVMEKFGLTAAEAGALLIQICVEKAIPIPSSLIETGRGIHAIWLFEKVSHGRLTHWKHTQRKIKEAVAELDPDSAVQDCPRMLRLCGTVNGRPEANEAMCRPIFVQGDHPLDPHRYSFEQLWMTIAPPPKKKTWKKKHRQAEIFSLTDAKGEVRPTKDKDSPSRWVSFYSTVLSDLRKVIRYKWPSGIVPKDYRNNTLMALMMCHAQTVHPAALNKMIRKEMAWMGWKEERAVSYMTSIVSRAHQLLDKNMKWSFPAGQDAEADPRYTPSAAWFIELFGVSREDMTDLDLRALIDKDRKKEINRHRKAKERGQIVEPLDRQGRDRVNRMRALMSGREIRAFLDKTANGSIRIAAAEMGLSKTTAHRHLQQYEEASDAELSLLSHTVPKNSLPLGGSLKRESKFIQESSHNVFREGGAARRPEVEHSEHIVSTEASAEGDADTANSVQKSILGYFTPDDMPSDSQCLAANSNISPFKFEILGTKGHRSWYYRCPQYLDKRLLSHAGHFVDPLEASLPPEEIKRLPVAPQCVYERARKRLKEETGELEILYEWCEYAVA